MVAKFKKKKKNNKKNKYNKENKKKKTHQDEWQKEKIIPVTPEDRFRSTVRYLKVYVFSGSLSGFRSRDLSLPCDASKVLDFLI